MHTMVTEAGHAAVTEAAYAKINIGLDVLRRRPDGYHELRMVMQTVALHDDVILTREEMPGIRLSCLIDIVAVDHRIRKSLHPGLLVI